MDELRRVSPSLCPPNTNIYTHTYINMIFFFFRCSSSYYIYNIYYWYIGSLPSSTIQHLPKMLGREKQSICCEDDIYKWKAPKISLVTH